MLPTARRTGLIAWRRAIPMQRPGTPIEVAEAVLWLLSPPLLIRQEPFWRSAAGAKAARNQSHSSCRRFTSSAFSIAAPFAGHPLPAQPLADSNWPPGRLCEPQRRNMLPHAVVECWKTPPAIESQTASEWASCPVNSRLITTPASRESSSPACSRTRCARILPHRHRP